MSNPIEILTNPRLLAEPLSSRPLRESKLLTMVTPPENYRVLNSPAILLDGRFPTSPLANASILENEKDRDYFGSLSHDKMQPPLPCIRCY
jgi:hypothetical protein